MLFCVCKAGTSDSGITDFSSQMLSYLDLSKNIYHSSKWKFPFKIHANETVHSGGTSTYPVAFVLNYYDVPI